MHTINSVLCKSSNGKFLVPWMKSVAPSHHWLTVLSVTQCKDGDHTSSMAAVVGDTAYRLRENFHLFMPSFHQWFGNGDYIYTVRQLMMRGPGTSARLCQRESWLWETGSNRNESNTTATCRISVQCGCMWHSVCDTVCVTQCAYMWHCVCASACQLLSVLQYFVYDY